jgi:hypothetical protein
MVGATALVLLLTAGATLLGGRLSGLLATFPLYGGVLAAFAHRGDALAAVVVLRGFLLGLFAFVAFFLAVGALVRPAGVAAAFGTAVAAALAVQATSLRLAHRI